jgi:hypothetical protein
VKADADIAFLFVVDEGDAVIHSAKLARHGSFKNL